MRTNERNVDTTRSERASLGGPPEPILEDPCIKVTLRFLSESEIRRGHALEDIVVVLGRAEHAWRRVRDIPGRNG
jgi:hypothetical protein